METSRDQDEATTVWKMDDGEEKVSGMRADGESRVRRRLVRRGDR